MTTAKIDTVLIEGKSRPVTILELQEKDTGGVGEFSQQSPH